MKIAFAITAALLAGGTSAAQQGGHDMAGMDMSSMHHMQRPNAAPSGLNQGGQAAFAAISEATAALETDPKTDWSKANIDALRQHLVDMDNVTLRADVSRTDVPGGVRFAITSADPRVEESINRMTRLHLGMANKEGPYRWVAEAMAKGTALTVTGPTALDQAKIRSLGFFGLLTEGVHHEAHHMMLAAGEPMNH